MAHSIGRREVLFALASTAFASPALVGPAFAASPWNKEALVGARKRLAAIETASGGRLGVCVIDTASGGMLAHRGDERFAMCSTFKLLASAAVLALVDAGTQSLDRVVPYTSADLLSYAPITKAHVSEGGMKLGDLCAAAMNWSDNTAANLILKTIGGPAGFTRFCRRLGDTVTRLDRNEPTLNTAIAGDPRDTTTPLAMAKTLRAAFEGETLSVASRRQLTEWAIADKVADKRVRAGVPHDWIVGDKTGTGDFGSTNTIGFLQPPNRKPLYFSVYLTQSKASIETREAAHKDVGALIASLV